MQYLFSLVSLGKFHHIRYTFPVRGHSFLPNDRDFGRTEVSKRKNERVYTASQWMDIIQAACKRKPFRVIPADQSMFLNFGQHFAQLFKKTVKSSGKSLNIQKARTINYSADHIFEVWVKYTVSEEEQWSKFLLLKACASASLPPPSSTKYIPIKPNKVDDIKKIVEKYVPAEHESFYHSLLTGAVSSETDESDY